MTPILEISYMVPDNNENGYNATGHAIRHPIHTQSKKCKISAIEAQVIEANRMESQRCTFEPQGINEYTATILFNNKKRIAATPDTELYNKYSYNRECYEKYQAKYRH
ncbi:hypothetical protein AYI69_g5724 [Smittium culicis]|uniref:Uncharacterized protein n=1 Tax=Smittium culicis TaxID=133412 RepID=A0A1R1Y4K1_9FUNG|nr:hypothetical protein AYI69_g5724 [Smittium culicis]